MVGCSDATAARATILACSLRQTSRESASCATPGSRTMSVTRCVSSSTRTAGADDHRVPPPVARGLRAREDALTDRAASLRGHHPPLDPVLPPAHRPLGALSAAHPRPSNRRADRRDRSRPDLHLLGLTGPPSPVTLLAAQHARCRAGISAARRMTGTERNCHTVVRRLLLGFVAKHSPDVRARHV